MLKSFLDGYNVTIMAYGQTGSGKSFTMGTSESSLDYEGCEGLIPRFVYDLFENLQQSGQSTDEDPSTPSSSTSHRIQVSFLEIYGEDVFDLLPGDTRGSDRPSLQVRENEGGNVVVQGQSSKSVETAEEAVDYLYQGMKNRITASTLMNAGSSRSHAVYVITLEQTNGSDDDAAQVTSKLTFVDLAGSERIGRTQAEGKLKKEGIQINSGLFCLGQVINGLADDQRLKSGVKSVHIPYRNSKLTHLLKDALGGNSQTLFLACVSPAESNESETHSTLTYAKAARNIRNKPVRNMDKTQMELLRLRYTAKAWMLKAVSHYVAWDEDHQSDASRVSIALPELSSPGGDKSSSLLHRTDVQEYIQRVNQAIEEKLVNGAGSATPRKVRLSMGVCAAIRASPAHGLRPVRNLLKSFESRAENPEGRKKRQLSSLCENVTIPDAEESERLIARMQAMVAEEKNQKEQLTESEEKDAEALLEMDSAILEKESILVKLMDTVKGFGVIKRDYERLVAEIGELEVERSSLEVELEKARCGNKATGPQLDGLKARYEKVKQELEHSKGEKRLKESAYKLMQKESKSCESLKNEIQKLKEGKVALIKQQKAASQQLIQLKKENQTSAIQSKRVEAEKAKQVSSLRSELTKKERVLGQRDREINRVCSKLRACEEHITQLLKMNRGKTKHGGSSNKSPAAVPAAAVTFSMSAEEEAHLTSSKKLLYNLLNDKILHSTAREQYERKTKVLETLNEELADHLAEMGSCLERLESSDGGQSNEKMKTMIASCETNVDRITGELELLTTDLEDISTRLRVFEKTGTSFDTLGRDLLSSLKDNQLMSLCWSLLQDQSNALERLGECERNAEDSQTGGLKLRERLARMESEFGAAKVEFGSKLAQAERQRTHDLWSVVCGSNTLPSSSHDTDALGGLVDSVGQAVAIQRALDLERELEESLEREATLKEDHRVLLLRVAELELGAVALLGVESDGKVTSPVAKESTVSWNPVIIAVCNEHDASQVLHQLIQRVQEQAIELEMDEFGLLNMAVGADVSLEALTTAVTLIIGSQPCSAPNFTAQDNRPIVGALESIQFALESIRLNRVNVSAILSQFLKFLSCYYDHSNPATASSAKVYAVTDIKTLFKTVEDAITTICGLREEMVAKLQAHVDALSARSTVLSTGSPPTLEDFLTSARNASSDELFRPLTTASENLEGIQVLVDEAWLLSNIKELSSLMYSRNNTLMEVAGISLLCIFMSVTFSPLVL